LQVLQQEPEKKNSTYNREESERKEFPTTLKTFLNNATFSSFFFVPKTCSFCYCYCMQLPLQL